MRTIFLSIQWMFFILTGSLFSPISVGNAYGLPVSQTMLLVQATLFATGVSSLVQGIAGHKLPILEGPAGLWWGVFLFFASTAFGLPSAHVALRGLQTASMISGLVIVLLSLSGVLNKVKDWFSPLIIGVYLILLGCQLSQTFVKGILGIGYSGTGVDLRVTAASVLTLAFSVVLNYSGLKSLKIYSVLISITTGWVLFSVLGLDKTTSSYTPILSIPRLFPWGIPSFNTSMVLTAIVITPLLLMNLIASIKIVETAVDRPPTDVYKEAGLVTGISQVVSGLLSALGCISNSHSAGFISTTNNKTRKSLVIGSMLILGISFFPIIITFLSRIPTPVGYAAVFIPIANLMGSGFRQLKSYLHEDSHIIIMAGSVMIGIGVMSIPTGAVEHLPTILVPFLRNGLVLGVVTAIIGERISVFHRILSTQGLRGAKAISIQ